MGMKPSTSALIIAALLACGSFAGSTQVLAKSQKKKPAVLLQIPELRVLIPEEMLRPSLDDAPSLPAKKPAVSVVAPVVQPSAVVKPSLKRGKRKSKSPVVEAAKPTSVDAAALSAATSNAASPASAASDEANSARALAECHALLDHIEVDVSYLKPLNEGECGTPQPVLLKGFGKSHKVTVNPPATINCPMVAKLAAWLETKVRPAAEKELGSRIVALANATSYACRKRNNASAGPLSEHAFANALDVAEFQLEDGRTIVVAKHWGRTMRDLDKAKPAVVANVAGSKSAKGKAASWKPDVVMTADKLAETLKADPVALETPPDEKLADKRAKPKRKRRSGELADLISTPPSSKEGTFLRMIHRGACELFGTVLGPEANEFHRDHLHLDLAHRRHSAYCE